MNIRDELRTARLYMDGSSGNPAAGIGPAPESFRRDGTFYTGRILSTSTKATSTPEAILYVPTPSAQTV